MYETQYLIGLWLAQTCVLTCLLRTYLYINYVPLACVKKIAQKLIMERAWSSDCPWTEAAGTFYGGNEQQWGWYMPPCQLLVNPPSRPLFQSESANLQQRCHQPQQNIQEVISQVTPSSTKGQKQKRSPNWSYAEISLLLEIWRDDNVQNRLLADGRNLFGRKWQLRWWKTVINVQESSPKRNFTNWRRKL